MGIYKYSKKLVSDIQLVLLRIIRNIKLSDKLKRGTTKTIEWIALIIGIVAGIFGILQFANDFQNEDSENLKRMLSVANKQEKELTRIKKEIRELSESSSIDSRKVLALLSEIKEYGEFLLRVTQQAQIDSNDVISQLKNIEISIGIEPDINEEKYLRRLKMLVVRKSSLEADLQIVQQKRLYWANAATILMMMRPARKEVSMDLLEKRRREVGRIDKMLEIEGNHLNSQRKAIVQELEATRRVMKSIKRND